MSDHIARLRSFKFYFDKGSAVASDELRDAMKLLDDYDALAAELKRLAGQVENLDVLLRSEEEHHRETQEDRVRVLARLAEAERDAERYRFLRNQDGFPTPEGFDELIDADMEFKRTSDSAKDREDV